MDSPKITYKYYSNPAFCAQSEVVYTQQKPCISPRITTSSSASTSNVKRIPPLGANSPKKILSRQEYRNGGANHRVKTDISDNPLRNIYTKNDGSFRCAKSNQAMTELPPKLGPKPSRNNSIRFENQKSKSFIDKNQSEELEMYKISKIDSNYSNAEEESVIGNRILKHRYAEIPDDYDEYSPSKKRIIETEPAEYNVDKDSEDENEIPTEIVRSVNGKIHRYAIIPSDDEDGIVVNFEENNENSVRPESPPTFHLTSPGMSRKNLEATQKLHELLATPKKFTRKINSPLKSCTSSPSLRSQINARSPEVYTTNFTVTPTKPTNSSTPIQIMNSSKSCANLTSPPLPRRNHLNSSFSPKAQQRLNYNELSPKRNVTPNFYARERSFDKTIDFNKSYDVEAYKDFRKDEIRQQMFTARSTAIISPRMASRASSSIYSDGTAFSMKKWKSSPGCATLVLAAAMLALCGGLAAALSFYMMYSHGREYYLDISVFSGFICCVLGLLGFRTHTDRLLPNRKYISGYIVISIFSLLTCGGLLTLLCTESDWGGENFRQMITGIIATLGSLCLFLATIGAVSSCCCEQPPPDNRVASSGRS